MYYYFNSSFGGFIRAYGNLNWVAKEPGLIHWDLMAAQTQGCPLWATSEVSNMKTGMHFNENTFLYWQGHPWHHLLGTTMDWPFSYYVHPFTALLLARCPFFCQSATHLRPKALQGKDNACKITRMQWNKSKQMFLRKCDLPTGKLQLGFQNAIHVTFSQASNLICMMNAKRVLQLKHFSRSCQRVQFSTCSWTIQLSSWKTQLRLKCTNTMVALP